MALQSQSYLSLIMFDVDHFKKFNDTYGHLAGDDCLKQIAKTVKDLVNKRKCSVYRYGGEEFAVILMNFSKTEAIDLAEEIRRSIEGLTIPHEASEVSDVVTVSCGINGFIPSREKTAEQLIDGADQALYQAKNKGRNQVAMYC